MSEVIDISSSNLDSSLAILSMLGLTSSSAFLMMYSADKLNKHHLGSPPKIDTRPPQIKCYCDDLEYLWFVC